MKELYLDNAATTEVEQEVVEDILYAMNFWGNPSSIHKYGAEARKLLEESREKIARRINAEPEEIIFTSGGSEANNLAIKGVLNNNKYNSFRHLWTDKTEHPSVNHADYGLICNIPVNKYGEVQEDYMIGFCPFVSVMMVNNELGTINNIQKIAENVHERKGIIHVDAVQAFPHLPIDVKSLGIDMMSVSGHKFGCPKGVGFLYVKNDINLRSLICGGHQEFGVRAGTENLPYIYAMANKIEKLYKTGFIFNLKIREYMEAMAMLRGFKINGHKRSKFEFVPIISITIPGVDAQQLIALLSEEGVYVSAGSACSSGEKKPSRVLKAIGLSDEEALSTIRVSYDVNFGMEDVELFYKKLDKCIDMLKM